MDKENIVLSNYAFKGILGKGTFSKVKLAINNITNEKVAIKIIEKQFILNKNNMDRVKREISILKNSCHPNIIKVIDIKEDTNNYYFIMEYCQLGELFLHIANNKRLEEKQASFYFYQLINGLNYLHLNRIVHRDLKPENLLLSKGKILKIIDFGLSNYTSENHFLNTPCGSPSYASPEMIKGKKYNGFMSDIWSCGVILYVMLYGYLPFEGFSNNDLFKKILKGKVNYPNSVDKSAVDLMKNILVVNPENRFNINKIKQHPFYLRGKGIFREKYPDLINEVEQINIININVGININININKTLKKSISDSFHGANEKNEDKKMKMNKNISSNSVNKNNNININNKKEEEKLEKKNSSKNCENNIYNNLLFHTKNINYYKKILSGRLNVHNIRRNKNKNNIDIENNNFNINNNEITPRNKNTYEKDYKNSLSNKKTNKSKNKNTISLTNNAMPSSKEMRKKNLQIFLKNSPFKISKKEKEKEKENSISIKTMEKYEINKDVSEEKKRVCTASFNENSLKSKYGCQSPNFLLLKKLLKNSQNHYEEKEKEKEINNIQESIVYNAQRETQIFNINHAINKIKKLKRIYENEINNGTNEIKNKEYFSINNSNSNFQINIKKSITKCSNDIQQNNINNNNYVYHKQNVKNNHDISPIRKIGIIFNGFNTNEKKNSKKKLSIHNSSQNTKNMLKNYNELMIFNNNKTKNENNKENSLNKKKVNSKNSIKEKEKEKERENICTDIDNINLNHPCIYIQSPKKLRDNFDQNDFKHIITNTNSLEKISLSCKSKVNYSKNKNNSNSIKVNKKAKNINRNKKLNEKKGNILQSSLTNKLNSIKKNYNLSNKDILIIENKIEKEEISNYINSSNKKFDTTRSQKYINNRSLGETININVNINTTNKKQKKRNKYSSLIENNSVYSEKQIKQIKNNIINKDIGKNNNNSNKDISKTETKNKE